MGKWNELKVNNKKCTPRNSMDHVLSFVCRLFKIVRNRREPERERERERVMRKSGAIKCLITKQAKE